ncbi:ketopantoate reductase family protein [Horticoccus sp. 23ND18S-11]|uniref:ketopantoate reductase family protein n=1 Tax=Horticoccus sp. 23ND18S-11 TaxID=3391832 RepID=UPI0039C8D173
MPLRLGPTKFRVAVVGAGAVGGYFGGMLARAGIPTVMIGREAVVAAIKRNGLVLDTLKFKETIAVDASTQLSAAAGADLILFGVKTTDTVATARALAPYLRPGCTVLSLQNGVENATLISAATGGPTIPAAVYLAAAMPTPGVVKHTGRGDLVIGPNGSRLQEIAQLFQDAGVGCVVSDRIQDQLWEKLICNCALNAISALCHLTYGAIGEDDACWETAVSVILEALAVARAAGVNPTHMADAAAAIATVRQLTRQIAGAYSSTALDLQRKKRTEIDALNGYIARLGRDRGVPTPVNQTLWALVRAAEARALAPNKVSSPAT